MNSEFQFVLRNSFNVLNKCVQNREKNFTETAVSILVVLSYRLAQAALRETNVGNPLCATMSKV